MIEIRVIDSEHKTDINIPNEPFAMNGILLPSYSDGKWSYTVECSSAGNTTEMCFPDENYDFEVMTDCMFLGAYDDNKCVGLAILQNDWFKYWYLYDLKVNKNYRRKGIGTRLMEKANEIALKRGYCGIYARGQDNNLGACLFYLNAGFYIGGLDTNVYRHTVQEGKADILFYCEAAK